MKYIGKQTDNKDIATKDLIPTVGNGTITINQGGTQKGTFTVNQTGNTTINLDAGGGDVSNKMDKVNPTGTGYFSLNMASGATPGTYSFTEGYDCQATGQHSHAEGDETVASGNYTHAEGHQTVSGSTGSHAEGWGTNALGGASHAEGRYTTAKGKSQHVFGEFNIIDNETDPLSRGTGYGRYVEIVGNGTQSDDSNARTLDWNGNETIAGNLRAAGLTDGTTTKTMSTVLSGLTASDATTSATANKLVMRDANGHIYGNYIEGTWGYFSASAASEQPNYTGIAVYNGNWLYKRSLANLKSDLGVPDSSNFIPKTGANDISGNLEWASGQTDKWLLPYLLAFKNADTSQSPTYPYTGFYQWGSEWQVNARDSSNVWAKNLLTIDNISNKATFAGNIQAAGLTDGTTTKTMTQILAGGGGGGVTSVVGQTGDVIASQIISAILTGAVNYGDKITSKSFDNTGDVALGTRQSYIKFQSGLCIVWGQISQSSQVDWTAFVNMTHFSSGNNYIVVATPLVTSASPNDDSTMATIYNQTSTGFTVRVTAKLNNGAYSKTCKYICIGMSG